MRRVPPYLKKIQNILQQFHSYMYFKELIAIESNHPICMKQGFMVVKPVINQCIGEELLRNYHDNTQPISVIFNDKQQTRSPLL